MNIQLSDHFTYKKLLRFTLPSIIIMIFTSIYGVVDGIRISIVTAEVMAFIVTEIFLARIRRSINIKVYALCAQTMNCNSNHGASAPNHGSNTAKSCAARANH